MGKGARKRQAHEAEKKVLDARAQVQKKESKTVSKKVLIIVSVILAVLLIAGGIVYAYEELIKPTKKLRGTIVAKSENFEVDAAMLSYIFYNQYYDFIQYYGDYTYEYFDPAISLKKQNYNTSNTWFDFFGTSALSSVEEELVLAELALERGVSLTEAEKNALLVRADMISDSGINFGKGVKKDDIYRALELSELAMKCQSALYDIMKYSDDVLEEAFTESGKEYLLIDMYTRSFSVETLGEEKAKNQAERLAATTDPESFCACVREIMLEDNDKLTEEEIEDALAYVRFTNVTYDSTEQRAEWLFDEARTLNETRLYYDEETSYYEVYMLTKLPHRNTDRTVNVRSIFVPTEEEANALLDEWKKGDATEESFAVLALRSSQDASTAYIGGLYEFLYEGQIYQKELESWCLDEARTPGDTAVIHSSSGYHVAYFISEQPVVWKTQMIVKLSGEDYSDLLTGYEELHDMEFDTSAVDLIDA